VISAASVKPSSNKHSQGDTLMSDAASYLPKHPPVNDWVNDFDHTDPR